VNHLKALLPPILSTRNKYQAGYCLGFAGSHRYPGAAKLAGLAALRSGAGIVRLFSLEEIAELPFELIAQTWEKTEWDQELQRAQALFVGPGLGKSEKTDAWLKCVLPTIDKKCVIDADALQPNLVFPKGSLLTPHRGEALRLLGLQRPPAEEKLLDLCQEFCRKRKVVIVLKGAPTYVCDGEQQVKVSFGDPGMATAGTGDVLTGVLAGLLAQGLTPFNAGVLGASLHGLAGEIVAKELGSYSMIASDLLHGLHQAFKQISH